MEPPSSAGPARPPGGWDGSAAPRVTIAAAGWRRAVPRVEALAARAAGVAGGAASIVLTADRDVRRLNARFRGRNKPTNVLTFEGGGGEMLLALGVVLREARAARRRPADHLAHLVVHGCLHLRGHDHQGAGEARRMEMEEARLLHRLRVPNPWKPVGGKPMGVGR